MLPTCMSFSHDEDKLSCLEIKACFDNIISVSGMYLGTKGYHGLIQGKISQLTHTPPDKMAAIVQTIFTDAFS